MKYLSSNNLQRLLFGFYRDALIVMLWQGGIVKTYINKNGDSNPCLDFLCNSSLYTRPVAITRVPREYDDDFVSFGNSAANAVRDSRPCLERTLVSNDPNSFVAEPLIQLVYLGRVR